MSSPDPTPTAPPPARTRRRLRAVGRWTQRVLAAVGVIAVVGLALGLIADVDGFDRTRGGYEPPYTGWTGTPIDWSAGGVTATGFVLPGYVTDLRLDCTSGMISVEAFGAVLDIRVVSDRAIAVHRPREACEAEGFDPAF